MFRPFKAKFLHSLNIVFCIFYHDLVKLSEAFYCIFLPINHKLGDILIKTSNFTWKYVVILAVSISNGKGL